MRTIALVLFLASGFAWSFDKNYVAPKQPETKASTEEQSREKAPISVKILPAEEAASKAAAEEEHRQEKAMQDEKLVDATVWLFRGTALLAFFTGGLWLATYRLSRDAKITGDEHATKMEKSIVEAGRAAAAMESVAAATLQNAALMKGIMHQQMRAYLTVSISAGTFQERERNLRFEILPSLLNSGHTPAHKMNYWARADILPFPLPDDFPFPDPKVVSPHSMYLGPHQSIELNAVVDDFVPDEDVAAIKDGKERRVHIWGVVTYIDAFGGEQATKFCHSIRWFGEGDNQRITGTYSFRHNEAT